MLMSRRCEKCGRSSDVDASNTAAACAHCGAIFAMVEAARQREPGPATRPGHAVSVARGPDFLAQLRASTNYPTFRAVMNLFYWFWLLLAALTTLGALGNWLGRDGGLVGSAGALLVAALFVFVGRFLREASMMLADIGDATLRTAELAAARQRE